MIKPFCAKEIIQNWNDGILKIILSHSVLQRTSIFLDLHPANNVENHWFRIVVLPLAMSGNILIFITSVYVCVTSV